MPLIPLTRSVARGGALLCVVTAQAESACRAIWFQLGAISAQVKGVASAETAHCWRFAADAGQDVRLAVQSCGASVAFSVNDMVDDRDRYQITSQKRKKVGSVHQKMRAVRPKPYTLTLSIH